MSSLVVIARSPESVEGRRGNLVRYPRRGIASLPLVARNDITYEIVNKLTREMI